MKKKMNQKLCRLCFVERTTAIGIFSAAGIELNVANAIRVHFRDEVIENDHLPNAICRNCWDTLETFHKFYNSVNEAKNNFMLKFVTNEGPEFIVINCDPVCCDDDIFSVKLEPISDVAEAEVETSTFDVEDNFVTQVEEIGNNHLVDDNTPPSDTNDFDEIEGCSNDMDDNDGNEYDPKTDRVDKATTRDRAHEITKKGENTAGTIKKSKKRTSEVDHLIPNYMDMVCELCEQPFTTLSEASLHYRRKHARKYINAKCCQRRLRMPGEIRDHIRYHLNPDKFKCRECGKACVSGSHLDGHLRDHLKLKERFECDICKKKIFSKNNLQKHIFEVHMNVKRGHECEICEKRFCTKYAVLSHVKQVHERRYQQMCHICAKVFTTKQTMLAHLREHSGVEVPRVNCEFCGKLFKTSKFLRTHVKNMHEQDGKVYECAQCQKQFAVKHALKGHIAYHHNFKLQECNICDKKCKTAGKLKEHMAIHTGIDLYTCNYCPRTFKANANKHTHCKRMHPDEWSAARRAKYMNK